MSTQELRPMGIGDILDATFRLYRQRFVTFLLIALVVYVPYGLLITFLTMAQSPVVVLPSETGGQPIVHVGTGAFLLPLIGVGLFAIFVIPLCTAALVYNISASYLGESLSAGQSYSRAAPRLLRLVWAQILVGVIVLIGFILLIVPGIIFSLWFLVVVPVVVLENVGGSSALGRSRELMRGNLGKGFTLMFVVGLLTWIIGMALGAVFQLLPLPHVARQVFLQGVFPALWLPIQTAPLILLYYDLRIRKEAFDLQRLSEALVQPAAI